MAVAYFHLIGGASGDMLLGALLDVGLSPDALEQELAKLHVSGYRLRHQQEHREGVSGTCVRVEVDQSKLRRWSWREFIEVTRASDLPQLVKERAVSVFGRMAEAEARAHRRQSPEQLHELGSVDTLVDVVGVVAGLHLLGVERVYASPLPLGTGVVQSGHGALPAAAPATMELIAMAQAPVVPPGDREGELVTPTGAAILTTLAAFERPLLRIQRAGYGLGARDTPKIPNALALWLAETVSQEEHGSLVLLETNVDDMSPQLFGHVQELLLASGALDVWFTPIQMKKNRPGVQLSVLLPASLEEQAVRLIFRETTTLGVRRRPVERHEAPREVVEVETSLGTVPVKVKRLGEGQLFLAPEYEVCRRIALERGMPLQEVLRRVAQEAEERLGHKKGRKGR